VNPVVAVTTPRFTLAEGPVWDAARERVLWVDIPVGLVLVARLHGDELVTEVEYRFDGHVGTVAVAQDGSLLVAQTRALTRIELDGTRTTVPVPLGAPEDRLNDGTCDGCGRLLVGTLSLAGTRSGQRLLQVDAAGTTVLDDDLGLANGMAFSADGTVLYSVDSVPGTIWRRTYDHRTGIAGPRELLVRMDDTPDGLCVDAEGALWLAVWGRGQVRRLSPAGELLSTIDVPAPHTTSVAFVGPRLDRLLVTTARDELSDDQLAEHPLSGSLFLVDPGVRGLATHPRSGELPS